MNAQGRIISKPEEGTRTVIICQTLPAFRGKGPETIECGSCNLPLISDVFLGQVKNLVIRCPNCDKYNDI